MIGVDDLNVLSQFIDKFGFSLVFTTIAVYIMYRNLTTANVKLSEAPSHGLPINLYDSKSKGAEAYSLLVEEFMEKDGEDEW